MPGIPDQNLGKISLISQRFGTKRQKRFYLTGARNGFKDFITKEELLDEEDNGYLVNDTLIMSVEVRRS